MKPPEFDVLITAEEAWPAFERAVLSAQSEIVAGFRIFDMTTRLRSPEALEIGTDWFDLLAYVIGRGVTLTLIVSDFDPVMATPLHEAAWRTVRQGTALAELADAPAGQIEVRAALHSAQAGLVPWLGFLPAVLKRKWSALRDVKGMRLSRQAVGLQKDRLPDLHTVTHHQKLAVIDNQTLYVGGLDMNERRYDTQTHDLPARQTWSDVQIIVQGPAARDARRHLLSFERVTDGTCPVQDCPNLKRTLSAPRRFQSLFLSPRTVLSEIEEAHLEAFHRARHLIYIETQYLRSSVITDGLIAASRSNPSLRAVIVLPALPDVLAFESGDGLDTRYGLALQRTAVCDLQKAFGDRITFASPVRPVMAAREGPDVLTGSPIIYVHTKVLIKDADYGLVGSANLNGRSLRWDTEVAVEVTDVDHVDLLRRKVMSHWWDADLPAEALQPDSLQPWWRDEIARNGVRSPKNRRGFLVPYDAENSAELAQALPGVTENVV